MFHILPIVARALLTTGVAFSVLQAGTALPAQAQALRGVLELFTSQGCSSCPPADALLAQLARDPGLLTLSLPIDYWDYIGWKDTLASPVFTARQQNYCRSRGDDEVYTPQVVVDGLTAVVGSDAGEIRAALASAAGQHGSLSVSLKMSESGDHLHIDIGGAAGGTPRTAGVFLMRVAKAVTVAIRRGENAGHSVTYTNVVRAISKIGDWAGQTMSFDVPLAATGKAEGDAYAVLLQAGPASRPGAILAACKSPQL